MKRVFLLLSLLTALNHAFSQRQRLIVNGWKNATNVARWNFTKTAFSVTGYNNMVADVSAVGNQTSTDPVTGWTLITNASEWEPYVGSFWALNNGEGGSSDGSPVYTDFDANALQGGFINAAHSFAVSNTTYPFEFTNLPAGTYELRVISSIKSSINSNLTNGVWYVKFGSNTPTTQSIGLQSNYTTPSLIFTGTISAGERIYFGPFTGSEGNTDATIANCIMITKTN